MGEGRQEHVLAAVGLFQRPTELGVRFRPGGQAQGGGGEVGQSRHHPHVFAVELAGLVVRNDPNRAEDRPLDPEGDDQRLDNRRRNLVEVGEAAGGIGIKLWRIAIQARPARAEIPGRRAALMTLVDSRQGDPAEELFAVRGRLQEADARRSRPAETDSRSHQGLQQRCGLVRHLPGEGVKCVNLGLQIGLARHTPGEGLGDNDLFQAGVFRISIHNDLQPCPVTGAKGRGLPKQSAQRRNQSRVRCRLLYSKAT